MAAAVAGLAALAAALGVGSASGETAGTCGAATALPCSADGNDYEASVEAVLSRVLGGELEVKPLATGLTGDAGDLDFAPDTLTRGQSFEWSYQGSDSNLAYVTVKAGDAYAIFGIAGTRAGRVDVTELLGRHDISHVGFWAAASSSVAPVPARELHGGGFLGNSRLGRIDNGTVPCVHGETGEPARCAFSKRGKRSGSWLESLQGDFARVGQAISQNGKAGGEYVIAAELGTDGRVPALEPAGNDSAGTMPGTALAGTCTVEVSGSSANATGLPLANHARFEVPTSSSPHPDGAQLVRSTPEGVHYYTGRGAALNDVNGTERDALDTYYTPPERCHLIWSGGYQVPGAKRPATAYGKVVPKSPLVWRVVASNVTIAN